MKRNTMASRAHGVRIRSAEHSERRAAIHERLTAGGWRLSMVAVDGEAWVIKQGGKVMSLIWSIAVEDDGAEWLHVSLAAPKRLPTWGELEWVHDLVIGDAYAYAVFSPRDRWVHINKAVGHLFAPLDGKPRLPEFSGRLRSGANTL